MFPSNIGVSCQQLMHIFCPRGISYLPNTEIYIHNQHMIPKYYTQQGDPSNCFNTMKKRPSSCHICETKVLSGTEEVLFCDKI